MSPKKDPITDDWNQFRSYLYLLARSHIGPQLAQHIDASDVVQQTLTDAYAKLNQFLGSADGQKAAWLRQILNRNLKDAIKYHQRAKRDIARQCSLDAAVDDSFHRADQWLEAHQSSPSHRVSRQEELLQLATALTDLPEAQREAIVLRHFQGLGLAEIAKQLDRSEAAVAGLVYRGLIQLRRLLDAESEA